MLPDPGLLLFLAAGAGLGAGVVLLIAGLRGFAPREGLPPRRWQRRRTRVFSPAVTGRVVAAVAVGALSLAFTRWPVAAAAAAALVLGAGRLFGGAGAERRVIARQEALATWTETLRDTIGRGVGLEEAIPASAQRAPQLISGPLITLRGQVRNNVPLVAALHALAATLDDAGADIVIVALIQALQESASTLPESLSLLADAARQELHARRENSAGRAGLRRGVQIILLACVLMIAYFLVFARTYVAWYATAPGQVALALELGLIGAGLIWLRSLAGDTPHRARFLSSGTPGEDPGGLRIVASLTRPADATATGSPPPLRSAP